MKKQSNIYALIYAVGLVLTVGIVLSVIYQNLHPQQQENAANDTKSQILRAALISSEGQDVSTLFNEHVKRSYLVDYHGNIVNDDAEAAFEACMNLAAEIKKPADARKLPVFECTTTAGTKYVIPVYGAGLWGPIWGYIAFDTNGDTIYGAYFAHQGETPGLGAEIEKPAFSNQFKGKDIFSDGGKFLSVKVCKPGQEPQTGSYVNGISGGTITSQGVDKMLHSSLEPYTEYLKKLKRNGK
ncbi:MAG: NADH:ubiquinone reductase (Na(+)-transporting) subunit C [Prevotella sp.]|nr:NADH:ubiquinone reductase (Na(+)-transporting) subunit C [Prevotella sp.]MCM1075685.1 NADH:ubiquinone reductase (Na(+)-transporting) subunit C [Ruminococcus sp.]